MATQRLCNAVVYVNGKDRGGEKAQDSENCYYAIIMDDQTDFSETIGDLYPNLTQSQRQDAEQNLNAYIRIIEQIANRVFSKQVNVDVEEN